MNRFLVLILTLAIGQFSIGQINEVPSIETDGPTGRMLYSGDTVIITGAFKHIYHPDSTNHYFSRIQAPYTGFEKANLWPNAPVTALVEDGKGGHLLFGEFTKIGDSLRGGIAHIDSNGNLSPLFADAVLNGKVSAAAVRGDTLFIGGDFTTVSFRSNRSVWILDSTDFKLKSKSDILSGSILSIDDGNGGWYLSGSFREGEVYSQQAIKHLDSMGNSRHLPFSYNGTINAMKQVGNELYLFGEFTRINGIPFKDYVVVLNLINYKTRNSLFTFNKKVKGAYPIGTDSLLIWGDFDTVSGVARTGFTLIGLTSYYVGTLNKDFHGGTIKKVLVSGRQVVVQGAFSQVDQNSHNGLCIFDLYTGQKWTWNPLQSTSYQVSSDIFILDDSLLYICGYFDKVNGQSRKNMACFRLNPGSIPSLLPWAPQPNGIPNRYYFSGRNLYVHVDTGYLSNIGNRKVIFKVDRSDTAKLIQHDLEVTSEPVITPSGNANLAYAFSDLNLQYRRGVALFSLSSGKLLDDIIECEEVRTIYVDDENIYLGGDFTATNKQYRKGFAVIDRSTLQLSSINPFNVYNSVKVYSITTFQNKIILSGTFKHNSYPDIENFAFINKQNGTFSYPCPKVHGYAHAMQIQDSVLYAAGNIGFVDGIVRKGFFSYDLNSISLLPDSFDMDSMVYDMVLKGDSLAMVGSFTRINNQSNPNFAVYSLSQKKVVSSPYNFGGGRPESICFAPNGYAIGGDFRNVGGKRRFGIAAFNPHTMEIFPWAPYIKGNIYRWVMNDHDLYLTGTLDSVGSIKANNKDVFVLDRFSDVAMLKHQFVLSSSATVASLVIDRDTLYIAGRFSTVDGQAKKSIALVNTSNYSAINWNLTGSFTGTIYSVFPVEDKLYVGGSFYSIGGASRNHLARLSLSNGSADSWNPNLGSSISTMTATDELQFYNGSFSSVFSSKRYGGNMAISMSGSLDSFSSSDDAVYPRVSGDLFYGKKDGQLKIGPKFRYTDFQYGNYLGSSFGIGEIIKVGDTVMISGNLQYARISAYGMTRYPVYGNFIASRPINYIWSDTLPERFCRATESRIPIHIQGQFNDDNKFIVELSDSAGNFNYPYTVAVLDSFKNGELSLNFHEKLPDSDKYRIRIVSTSPYWQYTLGSQQFGIYGATETSNFYINDKVQCEGSDAFIAVDTMGATNFSYWQLDSDTTSWNFTDSFEIISKPVGWYTISRIRIDNYGCRDTIRNEIEVKYKPYALIWSPINWDYCFDSIEHRFIGINAPLDSSHFAEWSIGSIANWDPVFGDTMDYTFSQPGSYHVEYIVHNSYGCYDTSAINFNLYEYPDAEITVNDSNVCLYDSIAFFSDSLYRHPYYTHSWTFGDTYSDTLPNTIHSYKSPATYKVTHRIETHLGCNDEQSIDVNVHSLPNASITVSDTLLCPEDSNFTLLAQAAGLSPFNYTWLLGDSQIWNKRIFIFKPDSPGFYHLDLMVIDSLGCQNGVSSNLEWLKPIEPLISMLDSEVCQGDSIKIEALVTAGDFYWMIDGKQGALDTQRVYYATRSMNVALLTLRNGRCYDTSNMVSPKILSYTKTPKLDRIGDSLFAGIYDHYSWNKLGTWGPADTFGYLWVQQEGDYFAWVKDDEKCAVFSDTVNIIFTGINSPVEEERFQLYPNPNQGKFIISSNLSQVNSISLYSASGKHIDTKFELNKPAELDLIPGMYWICIVEKDAVIWLQMIVVD